MRALADGSRHLQWVGWITPLGWTERIEPFAEPSFVAVAVILVVAGLFVGLAIYLREHRDTGLGLVGDRVGRGGPRVIRSALGLDWHLSTGGLLAWAVGMFVGLFVIGYLTRDMVTFVAENPTIDDMMIRIYGYSLAAPAGFLGVSFALVAMLLAVYVGHAAGERARRRGRGPGRQPARRRHQPVPLARGADLLWRSSPWWCSRSSPPSGPGPA